MIKNSQTVYYLGRRGLSATDEFTDLVHYEIYDKGVSHNATVLWLANAGLDRLRIFMV